MGGRRDGSRTSWVGKRGRRRALALVLTGILARQIVRAKRKVDFRGRNVVITGGSRGFGLLLARQFASVGATIVLCARDHAELRRAAEELTAGGAAVHTFVCDVGNADQVRRMLQSVETNLGPVDVLVNNAGAIDVGPSETMTLEDYAAAMRTHFWGPLYAIDAVLPAMRHRRFGRIVNIASIGGKVSVPHLLPYNASKFALVGLSDGLRAELAQHNVLVTTICPGLRRTGSARHAAVKGRQELEYACSATSDSLPVLSMDASRAARRIVEACR
jgi:NAD(P)-dependent dehydrogenase (short-subunit alcohol dehydrogenase family)